MSFSIIIFSLVFLGLASVIDFKFREIPSFILTSFLFVLLIANSENLIFCLIAGVFSLLLYDFGILGGVGDIKAIAGIGLLLSSYENLVVFMVLTMALTSISMFFIKQHRNKTFSDDPHFPFIPVLFIVVLLMIFLGRIY